MSQYSAHVRLWRLYATSDLRKCSRSVDVESRNLGIDKTEIRKQNNIKTFEYQYDSNYIQIQYSLSSYTRTRTQIHYTYAIKRCVVIRHAEVFSGG